MTIFQDKVYKISKYVQKKHIFNQCIIDYLHFSGTASSSSLLVVWFTHFYLNVN